MFHSFHNKTKFTDEQRYELGAFVNMLNIHGVNRYAEINSGTGDHFFAVMHSLPFGATGVAHSLGEDRDKLEMVASVLTEDGRKSTTLYGPSASAATRSLLSMRGPFDAMLVHSATPEDWAAYRKANVPIIGFVNINSEAAEVWKFVKASLIHTCEFLAYGSKMGIGCAWPNIPTR